VTARRWTNGDLNIGIAPFEATVRTAFIGFALSKRIPSMRVAFDKLRLGDAQTAQEKLRRYISQVQPSGA
jgi:hypothetical protein